MRCLVFAVASLPALGAAGCAGPAFPRGAERCRSPSYEADYAWYRGTGESPEDLRPLSREELEQEYLKKHAHVAERRKER